MRFISTKVHGILDYTTAPALLLAPMLLGWSSKARTVFALAGAGVLGYSLVTRYELGVYKALPMPAHLTLDAIGGSGLALAAALLRDEPQAMAAAVGVGLFEIGTALTTETQPPAAEQVRWFFQQAA